MSTDVTRLIEWDTAAKLVPALVYLYVLFQRARDVPPPAASGERENSATADHM